jgi:hypothetical protein
LIACLAFAMAAFLISDPFILAVRVVVGSQFGLRGDADTIGAQECGAKPGTD